VQTDAMDWLDAVDKFIQAPNVWGFEAPKKERKGMARERFLRSPEWKAMRLVILGRDGKVCACCGSVSELQIDHILPRSLYPELQLDADNLRVLCWPCNKAKSTKIITNEINGRSPESRGLTK